MIPEQNLPEAQPQALPPVASSDSESAGPGQGTSRSSRRRRRRRKSKTGAPEGGEVSQAAAATVQPVEGEVFQPRTQAPPQQTQQNGAQAGQQQAGNGQGKRWKKKQRRRERDRQRTSGGDFNPGNQIEPGNSAYGNNGGFARRNKQKQKGPRSFVGPMDHSYREANGNFADSPPATIEMNGNRAHHKQQRKHHYDHDGNVNMLPPELRAPVVNVTIPEDAPTRIYFFVDDLFIAAKINESSRKQGVKVAFLKNDAEVMSHLVGTDENHKPALIVFDLNNVSAKPLTLIPKIRTKLKRTVSIIGFLSALQGDLKAKAVEAGCDTVMPRSAFSTSLPNLLRRYGVDEDEEPNFNQ